MSERREHHCAAAGGQLYQELPQLRSRLVGRSKFDKDLVQPIMGMIVRDKSNVLSDIVTKSYIYLWKDTPSHM
jgi:hypothetical protein